MTHSFEHKISSAFFTTWGERLEWRDKDMLQQVAIVGVESLTDMPMDTVVMSHHKGLRENVAPARDSIAADTAAGWMTEARKFPWTVPSRHVPKNVVQKVL